VERLWADPGLTTEMGDRNVSLASRYTWDAYTSELIRVYERVLSNGKSPALNG